MFWYKYLIEFRFIYKDYVRQLVTCITFLNKMGMALIAMRTKRNLLAIFTVATFVGAVAFPITSDVIGQTYDAKERAYIGNSSMDANNHKANSLIHWVSTEASATTVDDEEDDDLGETGGDMLEAENDTEKEEKEGENEDTTSFRGEDCTF